eukprot:274708-Amphidinium_carterae.2
MNPPPRSRPFRRHVVVVKYGAKVVDDKLCIYIAQEDAIRKFSSAGVLLWSWSASDMEGKLGRRHVIPNHPALFEGHIYDCLTSGQIFALDMTHGHLVWSTRVGKRHIGQQGDFMTVHSG